ncbi:MAG: HAD family hydrolase [Deltaproteobacteria bacterium]|nr:HAD family hydrolase [Deltaproteobacteria bacterium]MBW2067702.1 HAD family hydrolase [Deltaproteobacteria bacterium]
MKKWEVKVIAFDCDGVLFDSKSANVCFYNTILGKFGLPPIQSHQEDFVHAHSAEESIKFLIADHQLAEKAWAYAKNLDFRSFFPYMKPYPFLKQCLVRLKQKFKTALATNRTVSTEEVLEYFGLKNLFDLVVCAADVPHPKPAKDMMECILNTFKVHPREVIYVGDSKVDEAFARQSGVIFVAFRNPLLDADLHVSGFKELLKRLQNGTL